MTVNVAYTSREALKYSGATYRQLDYWLRSGKLDNVRKAEGSGSRRYFSVNDIAVLRVKKQLSDLNKGSQKVDGGMLRQSIEAGSEFLVFGVDGDCEGFRTVDDALTCVRAMVDSQRFLTMIRVDRDLPKPEPNLLSELSKD